MSTRPIVVISALFCLLSYRSKAPPPPIKVASLPAVGGHSTSPPVAKLDVASVVDAGASPQAELIVGSKRGLEAWQRDGSNKRTISRGTALHPRWIDDSNILVVASREPNLAKGVRLERISLGDGKRSTVVKIPPFACKQPSDVDSDGFSAQDLSLDIQDPTDFIVDKGGRKACITLMDRNINMMNLSVEVLVDLTDGRVDRWLSSGEKSCIPPAKVRVGQMTANLSCSAAERSKQSAKDAAPFPFTFTDNGVLRRGQDERGEAVLKIRGYQPASEGVSPSGRWMILNGDQEDADYIHRSIVLLDRAKGEVYPIHERRSWPAPLRPSGKQKLPQIKTPIADACPAVGETDVRWLGNSADSELLIIDDLVVNPGAFSFSVKGRIAR
jgi:hypothetical protein